MVLRSPVALLRLCTNLSTSGSVFAVVVPWMYKLFANVLIRITSNWFYVKCLPRDIFFASWFRSDFILFFIHSLMSLRYCLPYTNNGKLTTGNWEKKKKYILNKAFAGEKHRAGWQWRREIVRKMNERKWKEPKQKLATAMLLIHFQRFLFVLCVVEQQCISKHFILRNVLYSSAIAIQCFSYYYMALNWVCGSYFTARRFFPFFFTLHTIHLLHVNSMFTVASCQRWES